MRNMSCLLSCEAASRPTRVHTRLSTARHTPGTGLNGLVFVNILMQSEVTDLSICSRSWTSAWDSCSLLVPADVCGPGTLPGRLHSG